MNSRRKFRAYHTEEKRMFQIETLGEWTIAEEIGKHDFKGYSLYHKDGWPKIEVMQCTGIKDSKGQDVYEGDILRTKHFIDHHGKQHYLHHKVVWSNEFLGWRAVNICETDEPNRTKNGSPQLWVYIKNIEFEIVGNIYENNENIQDNTTE